MAKKLGLYAKCFQKLVHIEEILMKLNMSFSKKDHELLEKYSAIWDKSKSEKLLKRDLIVSLHIIINI